MPTSSLSSVKLAGVTNKCPLISSAQLQQSLLSFSVSACSWAVGKGRSGEFGVLCYVYFFRKVTQSHHSTWSPIQASPSWRNEGNHKKRSQAGGKSFRRRPTTLNAKQDPDTSRRRTEFLHIQNPTFIKFFISIVVRMHLNKTTKQKKNVWN